MTDLATLISELPHRRLELCTGLERDLDPREWPPQRPDLATWADEGPDNTGRVILQLGCEWGAGTRYVELTPVEARRLAKLLVCTADDVSHARGQVAAAEVKAERIAAGKPSSAMDEALAQIGACFAGV